MNRQAVFEQNKPPITEAEALAALAADRMTLAFSSLPIMGDGTNVDFLALKFALGDGTSTVVLIDQFAAVVLQGLLERLADGRWNATRNSPAGPKPH